VTTLSWSDEESTTQNLLPLTPSSSPEKKRRNNQISNAFLMLNISMNKRLRFNQNELQPLTRYLRDQEFREASVITNQYNYQAGFRMEIIAPQSILIAVSYLMVLLKNVRHFSYYFFVNM